jgi:hypothetical protein
MLRGNKVAPDTTIDLQRPASLRLPPPPPNDSNAFSLINSHIAHNIELLIDTDDKNEKMNYGKEILERMKLDDLDDVGDINMFMKELLQLGFSGRVDVERVFSEAMYNAVNKCSHPDANESSYHKRNLKTLFENKHGRKLLRRIIWCSSRGDSVTSTFSQDALSKICGNLNGMLCDTLVDLCPFVIIIVALLLFI